MNDEMTASLVGASAPKDGSTFRREFARAMIEMSRPGVLTDSWSAVLHCKLNALVVSFTLTVPLQIICGFDSP